jgi:chloramphenicol O-acetyltransferase type B
MSDLVRVNLIQAQLMACGVEVLPSPGGRTIPKSALLEPPCSLKWLTIEHAFTLGAFSYAVSGFAFAVNIGRYCSIGENVQIGRQDHPTTWVSTSPGFYLGAPLFNVDPRYQNHSRLQKAGAIRRRKAPTILKVTNIDNDVWIGHGAYIRAGVRVGTGAVIGAHSVVVKDVPPYAVVAGNPATIKKYRIAPHHIGALLELEWWRYASWDLADLPMEDVGEFIQGFRARKPQLTPYEPLTVKVSDISQHVPESEV